MKLSRKESAEILKRQKDAVLSKQFNQAIDTAIQCMGETKLIKITEVIPEMDVDFMATECYKVCPITTEKFCPECGKKIIR